MTNARARHHCAGYLLGRSRSTRACEAREPRRDGCGRSMRHERPLHQRDAAYSVQGRAATCLLRPPTQSRLSRDKRTGARLRCLSLRQTRSKRACDARAPRRNGCGRSVRLFMAMHQRGVSSVRCKAVVRCARCAPPYNQLSRGKRAGAPLRWLSLGMRRSTRACDARTVRRDGHGRSARHRRPLHQGKASHSVQDRAATCLLRPPTHSRLSRNKHAGAPPLRWLSFGMRRSSRAFDAHAPRRDGCGRPVFDERPLHQREASCSVQGRAATCLLWPPTHSRLWHDKRAGAQPLRWLVCAKVQAISLK